MTNRKITIRFSTDKNGKRRAHYWGLARRWLPISVDAAELKLATEEAVLQESSRIRQIDNFWVVEILSPVSGWIVQGEHLSRAAAEADRKNWM